MKYAIIYIPMLIFISCTDNNHNTEESGVDQTIAWDTAAAFKSDSIVEMDEVYIPDFRKEDSTFSLTAFIIQPGDYRLHEVSKEMTMAKWHSIHRDNDKSTIAEMEVSFQTEAGENDEVAWIVTGEYDMDIHLANINNIKTGVLKQAALDTNVIAPGDNVYFEYGDIHYRLYASGYMSSDGNNIYNYRLVLEAQKNGAITQQILFAHSYYSSYRSCIIEFAGDIDSDNHPDMIIRDAESDASTIMLYLSGEAQEGQLLKLSGFHQSFIEIGC